MVVSKYTDIAYIHPSYSIINFYFPTYGKLFIDFNIIRGSAPFYEIDIFALNLSYYALFISFSESLIGVNRRIGQNNLRLFTVGVSGFSVSYNIGLAIDFDTETINIYFNGTLVITLSSSNGIPIKNIKYLEGEGKNSTWSSYYSELTTINYFPNECQYGVVSGYKTLGEYMSDGKIAKNKEEEIYWYK